MWGALSSSIAGLYWKLHSCSTFMGSLVTFGRDLMEFSDPYVASQSFESLGNTAVNISDLYLFVADLV